MTIPLDRVLEHFSELALKVRHDVSYVLACGVLLKLNLRELNFFCAAPYLSSLSAFLFFGEAAVALCCSVRGCLQPWHPALIARGERVFSDPGLKDFLLLALVIQQRGVEVSRRALGGIEVSPDFDAKR